MAISSPNAAAVSHLDSSDVPGEATGEQLSMNEANRIESHSLSRSESASARYQLIAERAYRKAEQRGFAADADWQDWFDAEREVDALLDPDL